jgi:hypothetical protein
MFSIPEFYNKQAINKPFIVLSMRIAVCQFSFYTATAKKIDSGAIKQYYCTEMMSLGLSTIYDASN